MNFRCIAHTSAQLGPDVAPLHGFSTLQRHTGIFRCQYFWRLQSVAVLPYSPWQAHAAAADLLSACERLVLCSKKGGSHHDPLSLPGVCWHQVASAPCACMLVQRLITALLQMPSLLAALSLLLPCAGGGMPPPACCLQFSVTPNAQLVGP